MAEEHDDMDMDVSLLDSSQDTVSNSKELPFNEDTIEKSTLRDHGRPFENWTEDEKNIIQKRTNYYISMVEFMTGRWARGPSKTLPPKEPEDDYLLFCYKGKGGRRKKKKVISKEKLKPLSQMSAIELSEHFKGLKVENSARLGELDDTFQGQSLQEMVARLKARFEMVNESKNACFNEHIKFGEDLIRATPRFLTEKKEKQKEQKQKET